MSAYSCQFSIAAWSRAKYADQNLSYLSPYHRPVPQSAKFHKKTRNSAEMGKVCSLAQNVTTKCLKIRIKITNFWTHSESNKNFFVSNWHSNSLTVLDACTQNTSRTTTEQIEAHRDFNRSTLWSVRIQAEQQQKQLKIITCYYLTTKRSKFSELRIYLWWQISTILCSNRTMQLHTGWDRYSDSSPLNCGPFAFTFNARIFDEKTSSEAVTAGRAHHKRTGAYSFLSPDRTYSVSFYAR